MSGVNKTNKPDLQREQGRIRMQRTREKRAALGLVQLTVFVHEHQKPEVKKFVSDLVQSFSPDIFI